MQPSPVDRATYGFTILGVGMKLIGTVVLDNREEIAAWASLAALIASVLAIACGVRSLFSRGRRSRHKDSEHD